MKIYFIIYDFCDLFINLLIISNIIISKNFYIFTSYTYFRILIIKYYIYNIKVIKKPYSFKSYIIFYEEKFKC